jgi:two-component system, LuxR family, response regulator FixJ
MVMKPPTVFVVDDDASVRTALTRLFVSVGVQVEVFASAAELLARAPRDEHGCVLLDIKMPGVTGIELQQLLKEAAIELPVVFLSAHADVPLTVRAMRGGALDVVTKPFREHTLLDAVHDAFALDARRHRDLGDYGELKQRYETLTPREQTVMALVVEGRRNREVASIIGTSVRTVKVHRGRVMEKMQASSLPHLVRMADRLGRARNAPVTSE